jgi:hypothetical protein
MMMMMITCINRVIMNWPHITSHEQFSSVVRQNRDIITPDSSAETSSDSEVFHDLSENTSQTFVLKPPILKTVTFTMSTKITKTSTTTTTTTTSPRTPPIYKPTETSILTYDGTTSAGTFIVKFNQMAKQFAWSHNQKCAQAMFYLRGGASAFYQKFITMSAIKHGCSREQATLDWREFCDALRASFLEEDTYEALERKLKQIKYYPLRSEAFFFQISSNKVFAKLRSLDKFHRNKLINAEAVYKINEVCRMRKE